MKKPQHYNKVIKIIEALHAKYPNYNMGRHLSTALDGYDLWSLSDKEMLFALTKYSAELEFDIPHEDNIELIIKDGMNLNTLLKEDLYGEDYE